MRIQGKRVLLILAVCALLPPLTYGQETDEEEPPYRGIGIRFRVVAGWMTVSGGDIGRGSRGMFDRAADFITSLGYEIESRDVKAFNSAYGLGAELAYFFKPRLGVGLRFSRSSASRRSELKYRVGSSILSSWSLPEFKASSFLLSLQYLWPVHRLLTVCVAAGPELHFVKHLYALNMPTPGYQESVQQTATARGLGAQASVGLELRLNDRVALVLEASGRVAKISGFNGTQFDYRFEFPLTHESSVKGDLYYLREEEGPKLAILAGAPGSGQDARKAALDFGGVAIAGGLRFRF